MQDEAAHLSISEDCITYLLEVDKYEAPDCRCDRDGISRLSDIYPLALYAGYQWYIHASIAEKCSDYDVGVAMKFYHNERAVLIWRLVRDPDHGLGGVLDKMPPPIYFASRWGLTKLVSALLDDGVDVNEQGGGFGNALQVASYHGHDNIVELLLDKGAAVDDQILQRHHLRLMCKKFVGTFAVEEAPGAYTTMHCT